MNIVWFNWKDLKNPLSGGAEVVTEELAKRLAADGHNVKLIVGGFKGAKKKEVKNGFEIIRVGSRFSVYYHAWRYYKENKLMNWAGLVIDEINTIPFFAKFYSHRPTIIFIHQLAREIWFYELPKPLGLVGYILEPIYLQVLNKSKVITISKSTKDDLIKYGYDPKNIKIISEGIDIKPLEKLLPKSETVILLSLGAIKPMKKTMDQLKAFEKAKVEIPELKFVIAGPAQGKYGGRFLDAIRQSKFKKDIQYAGKVTEGEKVRLMREASVLCVTSVREGWCLVVTEAASQGTPAVVYNVPGLRDSVKNNITGIVVSENSPSELADKIVDLLTNINYYDELRVNGWRRSQAINFQNSYKKFKRLIVKQ